MEQFKADTSISDKDTNLKQRKIIHCDCDCFYASVEMRDNPELRGRPLAVGGDADRRGVVATCNYEARQFGVHSAMASAYAKKLCPDIVFVRPRMNEYRAVSQQIREIFRAYTSIIEPLSLDEAFLDVSDSDLFQGSATRIAEAIRTQVRDELNITLSAGIAPNKFLAKIASDWNKPDGQFVVLPNQVESFLETLPVKKLFGVGKVTAKKMNQLGIYTCGDLRQVPCDQLTESFGSFGERLWNLSWGRDDRPVRTHSRRKSLSVEHTYAVDLPDVAACLEKIPILMEDFTTRLAKVSNEYDIHKGVVKIKFADFVQTTLERRVDEPSEAFFKELCEEAFLRGNRPVRLLGLGVRFRDPPNKLENNKLMGVQLSFDF